MGGGNSKKQSKIFKNKKYSFTVGEQIGRGGNGCVYDVTETTLEYGSELVLKCLHNKFINNVQRKNRFCTEIKTVSNLQKSIQGIIPILSYSINKHQLWYVMPKAISIFDYIRKSNVSIKHKIEIILNLAQVIKNVHDNNIFHRDVKPDNILVLNDKIMLTDFGLAFECNDELRNTLEGEKVGPALIRPPELENEVLELTDFSLSDVYLFAKTAWMIIKEDNIGFRGEYCRNDKFHYLECNDYDLVTFEPLHNMLEGATKDDFTKRISIDDCIAYLQQQLDVINGICENLNELIIIEKNNKIKMLISPDMLIYTDSYKIHKILSELSNYMELEIEGIGNISVTNIVQQNEDALEFISNDTAFLMSIAQIKINKNEYEFTTCEINKLIFPDYISIREYRKIRFFQNITKVIITEKIKITCHLA